MKEQGEERQGSTLLHYLGEDAEEVLDTTRISEEDRKSYTKVLGEFDKYFKMRKNIIFERAWLNRQNQLTSESAEQFITEVHRFANRCEFKGTKDELIRDRLVVGILDQAISERLQMEPDLTKWMIGQCGAVKAQQGILKGKEKEDISLHAVDKYAPRRKLPAIPPQTKLPKHKPPVLQTCRRCGKGSHPRQECPAREAICFCCNRRGHFGNQCLSSTVINTKGDLNELTMDYTS